MHRFLRASASAVASLALLCAVGLAVPSATFAQRVQDSTPLFSDDDDARLEVPIPTNPGPDAPDAQTQAYLAEGRIQDLAQYLGIVYNFLIGIAGFLAATMVVIGGFQYVASGGEPKRVGAAVGRIRNALIGLALVVGAYTLLRTINPNLVTLKMPGIAGVRTEINFLPFCDDLAESSGIAESDITRASPNTARTTCGSAGFVTSKIRDADGKMKDSRVWCVWRGDKAHAQQLRAAGELVSDYGCLDDNSISGERAVGSDLSVHTLSVCVPKNGISQADLNAEYDRDGVLRTKLGECQSCNGITDGVSNRLGWPTGDQSCQLWQNVANNGDPRDNNFRLSRKGILQDTRISDNDDRRQRMYYCGYSTTHNRCIYVPILCHRVNECDDYDDMVMNYCEATADDGTVTCRANQTLGSSWGRQTGNAAHLIPLCTANPCDKGGSAGCEVGGAAGTRNLSGVGRTTGGYVRMGARVLTGGILGDISCDAKE